MALERHRSNERSGGNLSWTPNVRHYLLATGLLVANELLSYTGFVHPRFGTACVAALVLLAAVLAFRRLEYGILLVLGELFVGGKGYLYSITIASGRISIRLALFLVVIAVWAARALLARKVFPVVPNTVRRFGFAFGAIVALGVVLGLVRGNGATPVFFDANAFLYAGFILVLASPLIEWRWLGPRLSALVAASATVLGLKSLVVLGLFVHRPAEDLITLYHWIRDTGVGEIAPIFGGTFRVFMQGQVYGMLAIALLTPLLVPWGEKPRPSRPWWLLVPITLGAAAVLVSLSRSFWLGTAAVVLSLLGIGARWYRWNLASLLGTVASGIAVVAAALFLNSWALNFPYPLPRTGVRQATSLFAERIAELGGGAATASRMELFHALVPTIARSPVFGSGFGTSITYRSSDPRQISGPNHGIYTTDAFELGYLDLAVKVGVVGVVVLLAFLGSVIVALFKARSELSLGFIAGMLGLVVTHATTPYLNHPLGIGFVLLAVVASVHPTAPSFLPQSGVGKHP